MNADEHSPVRQNDLEEVLSMTQSTGTSDSARQPADTPPGRDPARPRPHASRGGPGLDLDLDLGAQSDMGAFVRTTAFSHHAHQNGAGGDRDLLLACGADNGLLRVIDLRGSGGHYSCDVGKSVKTVAWAPHGHPKGTNVLAAGGKGQLVTEYEVRMGRQQQGRNGLQEFRTLQHGATVRSITYAPDGSRIAAASASGEIRVWATAGASEPNEPVWTWPREEPEKSKNPRRSTMGKNSGANQMKALAYNADGSTLAAAGEAAKIVFLDARTGAERLVAGEGGEGADEAEVAMEVLCDDVVNALAWDTHCDEKTGHCTSRRIAAGLRDNQVIIYDVAEDAGTPLRIVKPKPWRKFSYADAVHAIAWNLAGTQLAVAGRQRQVVTRDVMTGAVLRVFQHERTVLTCAWAADGSDTVAAGGDGCRVVLHNAGAANVRKPKRIFEKKMSPERLGPLRTHSQAAIAWAPDGATLALATGDELQLLNKDGDKIDVPLDFMNISAKSRRVSAIAWSADGSFIAMAEQGALTMCRVSRVQPKSGRSIEPQWQLEEKHVLTHTKELILGIAFSPCSECIATGGRDSIVTVFRRTPIHSPPWTIAFTFKFQEPVWSLAWARANAGHSVLAVGHGDGLVLFDFDSTGAPLSPSLAPPSPSASPGQPQPRSLQLARISESEEWQSPSLSPSPSASPGQPQLRPLQLARTSKSERLRSPHAGRILKAASDSMLLVPSDRSGHSSDDEERAPPAVNITQWLFADDVVEQEGGSEDALDGTPSTASRSTGSPTSPRVKGRKIQLTNKGKVNDLGFTHDGSVIAVATNGSNSGHVELINVASGERLFTIDTHEPIKILCLAWSAQNHLAIGYMRRQQAAGSVVGKLSVHKVQLDARKSQITAASVGLKRPPRNLAFTGGDIQVEQDTAKAKEIPGRATDLAMRSPISLAMSIGEGYDMMLNIIPDLHRTEECAPEAEQLYNLCRHFPEVAARTLSRFPAAPMAPDHSGNTALHLAVRRNDLKSLQVLLLHQDGAGKATAQYRYRSARWDFGLVPNFGTKRTPRETALGMAIRQQRGDLVQELIDAIAKRGSPISRTYVAKLDIVPLVGKFPELAERLFTKLGLDRHTDQNLYSSVSLVTKEQRRLIEGRAFVGGKIVCESKEALSTEHFWALNPRTRLIEQNTTSFARLMAFKWRIWTHNHRRAGVEARVLPLPCVSEWNEDLVHALSRTPYLPLFETAPVKIIMHHAWTTLHFAVSIVVLCVYIVLLACFSSWLMLRDKVEQVTPFAYLSVTLSVMFLLYEIIMFMEQIKSVERDEDEDNAGELQYETDRRNSGVFSASPKRSRCDAIIRALRRCALSRVGLDMCCSVVVILVVTQWLATGELPDRALVGISGFLGYIKLLSFLRMFRPMASFVALLFEAIKDAIPFMSILLIVILGFGTAFQVVEEFDGDVYGQGPLNSFYATFLIAQGELFIESGNFRDIFSRVLQLSCLILVPVVMMNLLIAIISDSFERVQEKATARFLYERAQLIRNNNTLLYSLRILSAKLCCNRCLRQSPSFQWLHVLQPSTDAGNEDRQKRGIRQHQRQLQEELKDHIEKLGLRVRNLEGKLDDILRCLDVGASEAQNSANKVTGPSEFSASSQASAPDPGIAETPANPSMTTQLHRRRYSSMY